MGRALHYETCNRREKKETPQGRRRTVAKTEGKGSSWCLQNQNLRKDRSWVWSLNQEGRFTLIVETCTYKGCLSIFVCKSCGDDLVHNSQLRASTNSTMFLEAWTVWAHLAPCPARKVFSCLVPWVRNIVSSKDPVGLFHIWTISSPKKSNNHCPLGSVLPQSFHVGRMQVVTWSDHPASGKTSWTRGSPSPRPWELETCVDYTHLGNDQDERNMAVKTPYPRVNIQKTGRNRQNMTKPSWWWAPPKKAEYARTLDPAPDREPCEGPRGHPKRCQRSHSDLSDAPQCAAPSPRPKRPMPWCTSTIKFLELFQFDSHEAELRKFLGSSMKNSVLLSTWRHLL